MRIHQAISPPRNQSETSGFTLLELLAVLVIIGVIASISASRLSGMRTGWSLEQAARLVQAQVVHARHLAISYRETIRLCLDPDSASVGILVTKGGKAIDGYVHLVSLSEASETIAISFVPADGNSSLLGPVNIDFMPDSVCDRPGVITLACRGRTATIAISPSIQPPTVAVQ